MSKSDKSQNVCVCVCAHVRACAVKARNSKRANASSDSPLKYLWTYKVRQSSVYMSHQHTQKTHTLTAVDI